MGTPTRLISYQNGTVRSINWEQFSGDIEMKGDDVKGDLTLQIRSGRMVRNGFAGQVLWEVFASSGALWQASW